jgi:Zn-dependent protease
VLFNDPGQFIINSMFLIPGLLFGLVLHEWAHAQVAVARGDQTPRVDGRLSLDPSHHLDPIGTIAILLIHFGWAKPVRINPSRMRHRLDPALVALAGPLTNLLIAIAVSIPLKLLVSDPGSGVICSGSACFVQLTLGQPPLAIVAAILAVAFYLNVVLAVFNLLPIPPLDGYNLVATLFRRQFPQLFFTIDANRTIIALVFVLVLFLAPGVFGHVIQPVFTTAANALVGTPVYPFPGF